VFPPVGDIVLFILVCSFVICNWMFQSISWKNQSERFGKWFYRYGFSMPL